MNPVKVLLLCSSRFALPAMRNLFYSGQLTAVVIPSSYEETMEEVQQLLAGSGIPVIAVSKENCEAELKKIIKKYQTDLVFMLTFPYRISKVVYEMPVNGFYNFHPGPLPEYRGPDPVFQQIKNCEPYAGVTVHRVDEGLDTGPVVMKEMLKTNPADTYGILNNKLAELAAKLSGILIKMAVIGISIPAKPQDEQNAGYFKKQTSKEICIKWETMNADSIIALIHACNPWNKGAVTSLNHKIIRMLDASKSDAIPGEKVLPGTVIKIDAEEITVAVLHNECILINYIYIDEGFMKAGQLSHLGVTVGSSFHSI